MTLRYPKEIGGLDADYVTFTPIKYRSNAQGGPSSAPSGGQDIVLYMPNSTPAIGNSQAWQQMTTQFVGPSGDAKKRGLMAVTGAISDANANSNIDSIVSNFKDDLSGTFKNVTGVVKQEVLNFAGSTMGLSANHLQALSRGRVYNPNVELLYSAPGMRSFTFDFDFVPKDPGETETMNQIILNFKKWSSPKPIEGGMFEVPHAWQVKYMSGAEENQYMNRFLPAACTSVNVRANAPTDMHVSHEDGSPIITSLTLQFQEVQIITRKDHMDVGGQGY